MELTKQQLTKWKRRRLITSMVFSLSYLLNGMAYALFINTAWSYVVNHLDSKNPYLIYSLMSYMRHVVVVLLIFPVSNLHDKYRRTKLSMLITNFICIIGTLYTIDSSYYFPLIGCGLIGCIYLVQPIAVGELSRSYLPEQLTYILPLMNFGYVLGILPASLILYVTRKISFRIGPFLIDYSNFFSVLMFVSFSIMQILTILLVDDLSREFDLKKSILFAEGQISAEKCYSAKFRDEDPIKKRMIKNKNAQNIWKKLGRLSSNCDVLLMYCLVGLFYYCWTFAFAYLPPLIENELHYNVELVDSLYLVYALFLIVFLPVIALVKVSSKIAHYVGIISFILILLVGIFLKLVCVGHGKSYNICLLYLVVILFAVILAGEDVFLTCTIAKFVKSDIQSFADGVRCIFMLLECLFGGLSIALVDAHKNILFSVILVHLLISLAAMIKRKKTLMNPQAIV